MKLSLIAVLISLTSVACAARQLPPENYGITETVTKKQLPTPAVQGEVVEVLDEIPQTREEYAPQDYERLSSLIHRETTAAKCFCTSGDPFCRCNVPTLHKMPKP
jgi:hypothetical protein